MGLGLHLKSLKAIPMKTLLLSILFLISLSVQAYPRQCSELFQDQVQATIHNLAVLRMKLDRAQAGGVSSLNFRALEIDYKKKEQTVVEYLERFKLMSRAELVEKIKAELIALQSADLDEQRRIEQERQAKDRRKEDQIKEIIQLQVDGNFAIFHRIEPGKFKMGKPGKKVDVEITKSFDLMATATTQVIWKEIAHLANKTFGGKYKIKEDPSSNKGPTRPVDHVSYELVQEWIRALNELSTAGAPELQSIIPSHKMGDVYRLPTEAEWEFVIRGRGIYNDTFFFGNDASQIDLYAWTPDSSGKTSQPVAKKLPLTFEGKDFYDMLGNIDEWVSDWYHDDLPGGVDPDVQTQSTTTWHLNKRVSRGGGWFTNPHALTSDQRSWWNYDHPFEMVGFRLARSARAENSGQ
jgi:formylglycine-generating enzyme required for sulfatase activity